MLSLTDRLIHIAAFVCTLIGRILPDRHQPVAEGPPLRMVLHNRIIGAARRFARLFDLWSAGRLPPPRPPRPTPRAPTPLSPQPPAPRPSRARAWLVNQAGHHAAAARAQLEAWLEHPDLPTFIAEIPRAGRHIRPLAHMLGADLPAFLRLPPRPRRPRPPRPGPPRPPRTPRWPSLTDHERPLEPYVIRAVRYARKNRL